MSHEAALLLLAAVAHLAPESVAEHYGHSVKAWEYVARGVEGMALWALAATHAKKSLALAAICAYGLWESAQMAVCRAAHPMTHAPVLPDGQGLCTAAGWAMGYFAPAIISAVAFVFVITFQARKQYG